MKAKANVQITGAVFEIGYAAAIVEAIYDDYHVEFVMTSCRDSMHGTGSLHYKGLAFDCRTRAFVTKTQGNNILKEMRKKLEPLGFDVVDERLTKESPHFHVEFQPKGGEKFLEVVA